ncbi:hypothetical protein [Parasitella parasitica]|uniref:C2H2-type domain-containing protein n=1 Tax=Parasitella parasitica TaxID=35722 RepID=A0A0B7N0A1_9FUNG|nr:hypothetical protein [Parasitella parasitica]
MTKAKRRTGQFKKNSKATKSTTTGVEPTNNNTTEKTSNNGGSQENDATDTTEKATNSNKPTENDITETTETPTSSGEPMEIDTMGTNKKALASIISDFPRRYTCHECEKDFSCGSSLKRHLLDIHNQEIRLKYGRTFKGGRAFSNHRYYLKHRKLKENTEKTGKQLSRAEVNQRAYQKRVFKKEAESLKEDIIKNTKKTLDDYKGAKDLRKKLKEIAYNMKAFHRENMYLEIQRTLGFADTFEIQYSIAFYFILAIANRLPKFINLDYDKKEVALGLCWQNSEKDGELDDFECDENIIEAMFASLDSYFLGKGKKVKEQKHNYMVYIATFLNVVFTACNNRYIIIKKETNPCYLLRSLFNEPLVPLPLSSKKKKKPSQDKQVAETDASAPIAADDSQAEDFHTANEDDEGEGQENLSDRLEIVETESSTPSDDLMEDTSSWPSSNQI